VVSAYNLVTIIGNPRRQLTFATKSMRLAEAELVIKLIQSYVTGTNDLPKIDNPK
jgi:hypothetical protein